jgi:ATP-dependent Clp protease ATP-binding subunit ClpC
MFAHFTGPAVRVMRQANDEARRYGHEYVGTEHVLLALVAEESGVAAGVLGRLGVSAERVTRETNKILQHGVGSAAVTAGRLPHTPRTKKVVEYAVAEARERGDRFIDTGHLLVGLMREDQGVASQILQNFGLTTLDQVRAEVLKAPRHESADGGAELPPGLFRGPPSDPISWGVYDRMLAARARKEASIQAHDYELAAREGEEEIALLRELARLGRPDR